MKNQIIDLEKTGNPSILLYHSHREDILSVRKTLFTSLDKRSPSIGKAARKILQKKLNHSPIKDLPMMFELFPWLMRDLSGLDKAKTKKISVSWLAIYLYVSFLDDCLDSKNEINADEFLSASVLAQKGLINLFKIVNGTKFESLFNNSLFTSANFQLLDVLEQARVNEDSFAKANSASGKNGILIACAGAFAASKNDKADFIVKLTNKLLLTVQFLDDLADFEEDFASKNITVLLNNAVKEGRLNPKTSGRNKLIQELISSGSLLSVVKTIESSLTTAIILINQEVKNNKKENPSYNFFTSLYLNVVSFRDYLESNQPGFSKLPFKKRSVVIEEIDKAIKKIYLHT